MGKKEYVMLIGKFISALRKDFDVNTIIFFGSRAAGTESENSDFDLIIVSDDFEGLSFFKRVSLMYDYWKVEVPVDFLCYTRKEFNSLKKKVSLVSEAVKSGIVMDV